MSQPPAPTSSWPSPSPSFSVRTTKVTTPAWLLTLLSLPADSRVLHVNTALTALFTPPTSIITITSPIPLPARIYGPDSKLDRITCRLSNLNTGSIRNSTVVPGHITLVLHDTTKATLMAAYDFFLGSFPMIHVKAPMKELLRAAFKSAVDKLGWKVGIEALKACDSAGCANLKNLYKRFIMETGYVSENKSPSRPRGRPRKYAEMSRVFGEDYPKGLRELVTGAVEEVKALFSPSLVGGGGGTSVRVNIWCVKWRVPAGKTRGGKEVVGEARTGEEYLGDYAAGYFIGAAKGSAMPSTSCEDSKTANAVGEGPKIVDTLDQYFMINDICQDPNSNAVAVIN
ncbi:uncharacterized protein H6S33_003245 [Morchella sextelata]|uniref:uncharacterized protein n=1 Tax=Morchella sextelata TaxID=1174677 RepID=UPI001D05B8E0|nr:uncharacterized protein H6S33_003245 [Morchella sextelata]KAH0607257.1 hypothetical protein H6S33_003245 [Morchella sextelata]